MSDLEVTPFVDPVPPTATPVVMTDAYVQINSANLKCLAESVSLEPDDNPIEVTTFCGVQEFPGPTKWHFKAKFVQSFDTGATDATLSAAVSAYQTAGTLATYKVRAYASRAIGVTNPSFEGSMVPKPYTLFGGDAAAASEVEIDWIMTAAPTRVTT